MSFLKNIIGIVMCCCTLFQVTAQDKVEIMHYPKDWRFEKIPLPLGFAKDILWEGLEEVRFAPGMFNDKSDSYFTYYFGIRIENREDAITKKELKEVLEKYYKGLCKAVNGNDKFPVNYNEIKFEVEEKGVHSFKANGIFFDVFTDGKRLPIELLFDYQRLNQNTLLLLTTITPQRNSKELKALHKKNVSNNMRK